MSELVETEVSDDQIVVEEADPEAIARAQREERYRKVSDLLATYLGNNLKDGPWPNDKSFPIGAKSDQDRLEALLAELVPLAAFVPLARGFVCLGFLYLATNVSRKGLFGRPNPRVPAALRAGLNALPRDPAALAGAAALFDMGGPPVRDRFFKVLQLIADYVVFCGKLGQDPYRWKTVEDYVAAERP